MKLAMQSPIPVSYLLSFDSILLSGFLSFFLQCRSSYFSYIIRALLGTQALCGHTYIQCLVNTIVCFQFMLGKIVKSIFLSR